MLYQELLLKSQVVLPTFFCVPVTAFLLCPSLTTVAFNYFLVFSLLYFEHAEQS